MASTVEIEVSSHIISEHFGDIPQCVALSLHKKGALPFKLLEEEVMEGISRDQVEVNLNE